MNVRQYSIALMVGSLMTGLAFAQAPVSNSQQPTQKTAEQPKAAASTASSSTSKSADVKTASATHNGKHVAKAVTKIETNKSAETKKDEIGTSQKTQEATSSSKQLTK